jgi:hypothetical protein
LVLGELAGDICLWTGVSHDPDRGDDIEFNGIVFYFFCAWELNGIAVCVCLFFLSPFGDQNTLVGR